METKDIRRANMLALAKDFGTDTQFASIVGMATSYFSQIKTARKEIGDGWARASRRRSAYRLATWM